MNEHEQLLAAISEVKEIVRYHVEEQFHLSATSFGQVVDTQARIVGVLDGKPETRLDGSMTEPKGGLRADVAELKARNGMGPVKLSGRTQMAIAVIATTIATVVNIVFNTVGSP